MSTAGKVLTVLVLLSMVVWLVAISAVTQLNVNWQQKIAKQVTDTETASEGLTKATKGFLDLTDQARGEQAAKDRDIRELEGRIIAAERRQSSTREDLSRLQIQVADYLAAVKRAETNNATRLAEKTKTTEDLAKKKDEVGKMQAVNADLRDQLAKLQDDFKRLLAENSEAVRKVNPIRPAPKPASDRRPSPAS